MIETPETLYAAQPENASPMFSGEAPGCARPILFSGPMIRSILAGEKTQTRRILSPQPGYVEEILGIPYHGKNWDKVVKCPCGRKGDRLYVRETWAEVPHPAPGPKCKMVGPRGFTFRADWNGNPSGFKWRPSIHMPKLASRITLEVVDVRLEHLGDISVSDAIAEGVGGTTSITPCYARERFKTLWESISGPGSWDLNPWVWAVSFRVV